jgi:hypothetical protein
VRDFPISHDWTHIISGVAPLVRNALGDARDHPAEPLTPDDGARTHGNTSRHFDNVDAVTFSSRDTVSRSSPFNSRNTAATFRFADQRPEPPTSDVRFDPLLIWNTPPDSYPAPIRCPEKS